MLRQDILRLIDGIFTGITCPQIAAPTNGQVNQPAGSPEYGSQATFTCNSGYRYNVYSVVDVTLAQNIVCIQKVLCIFQQCLSRLYRLDGDTTTTCGGTDVVGTWSAATPVCHGKQNYKINRSIK